MRVTPVPRRDTGRTGLLVLVALLACTFAARSDAQTPISLFRNFVGHVNYQATGGSLRAAPNTSNACSLVSSSTAAVAGIPAGASMRAAYLYWAGSGSSVDATVTLNGSSVTASRTFTNTYTTGGTDYDFFAGFADVTPLVAGNGTFTLTGLGVTSGAPHCAVQAVLAGWSLVVVYAHPSEDLRAVNVFDGFQLFRASSLALTIDTFRIPPAPVNGKVTHVTWEGDPQNSGTLGGVSESLTFNGGLLDDGLVPPASAPSVQQFDGTINTLGTMTSHGVDIDTYDVSALLSPGDTSASTTYSSGSDLVLLSAEIISFTTEPVVDLEITKSHAGNFVAGTTGDYVLGVRNLGPENEVNPITASDALPAGLSYVGGAGTGWSCAASGQNVTCSHAGPLAVGAALPDLTIRVDVSNAAAPFVTNTATVTTASVDANAANDSSSDATIVIGTPTPTPGSGTKTLYLYDLSTTDPNGFGSGPQPYLSRTPPPGPQNDVTVTATAAPRTWTLTPTLQAPLTIDAGAIPVTLFVSKGAAGGGPVARGLTVALATTGATAGPLGTPVSLTFAAPPSTSPLELTFNVPLAAATTLAAGTQIGLTVTNTSPGGGAQMVRLFPTNGAQHSRVDLDALTVVDVAAVASFDAAFPGGVPQAAFAPGETVAVRADVGDPFGVFDINAVRIDVLDGAGNLVYAAQPLARIQTLSGASARYELVFTLPAAASGTWTYVVTAIEGVEGAVTHTRGGSFTVGVPRLTMTKSLRVVSDPANGSVNPKAIPGAVVLYSVTVSNTGAGGVDAGSVNVSDMLPAELALYVGTAAGDPIVFVDGAPPSGLTFDYATAVRFSNQPGGGAPYTYTPTPDATGFDPLVTGIAINPAGALAGAAGGGAPEFTLRYRARIE